MSAVARNFKHYQPPGATQSQASTSYAATTNLFNVQQRAQQLAAQNAGQSQGTTYAQKPQNTIRDDYERKFSFRCRCKVT